jgi:chromosome segregation ATPase
MVDWYITVIVAIIASGSGWYAIWMQRKKSDAETDSIIGETYKGLFDELKEKIKEQGVLIAEQDRRIVELERAINEKNALVVDQDKRITELERALAEKDTLVAEQNSRINDLETEVDELRAIMREHKIEPPPRRRAKK